MLIKNNKIIVRKCKKDLFEEVLRPLGYEKLMVDGKTLVVPFHVFNEMDLFQNLIDAGISFYAVPLNEDHQYVLTTDRLSIMSTCNIFEKDSFVTNTDFTNTVELIRLLSYQCENSTNSVYDALLTAIKTLAKNPDERYSFKLKLERVAKYLVDNLDNLREKEKELIASLEKSLDYNYVANQGEDFLKECIRYFIFEQILKIYTKADLVFWYNALPAFSKG